jgi:O-antigen ligase
VKLILFGLAAIAVFIGASIGRLDVNSMMYIVPMLLAAMVLVDYRIGVCFIAIALPVQGTPMLPVAQGFNPITFAILAAACALVLSKIFGRSEIVWPPKAMVVGLGVPLIVGAVIAWPHLPEGFRNFPDPDQASAYLPGPFVKSFVIRPMMFLVFAVLLANAVRDSKRPERFIWLLSATALIPAIAIVYTVLTAGISLSELQGRRGLLADMGLHPNGAGRMLAVAIGPIFWATLAHTGSRRVLLAMFSAVILTAIFLTFTRQAYAGVALMLAILLWQKRRLSWMIWVGLLLGLLWFAGPEAFRDRVMTGVDAGSVADAGAGSMDERLTAGRVGTYQMLLPEVARSPLWGRGTGSTAWSEPVTRGLYVSDHPHNMYLAVAMDLGLLGLLLIGYFYWRHLHTMAALARSEQVSPVMRAFFAGAMASVLGYLLMSFVGGGWFPEPDHTYLWIVFGMLYAYWGIVEKAGRHTGGRKRTANEVRPIEFGRGNTRPTPAWPAGR